MAAMLLRASRQTGVAILGRASLSVSAKKFSTSAAPVDEDLYNRQRNVIALGPRVPAISSDAWVAPSATVIGDVDVIDFASIWYGAIVRGDVNHIRIGPYTNVQDKVVIHAAKSNPTGLSAATVLGSYVSVGSGSILRSTTIGDNVVLGKKCILMEGSVVEKEAKLEDMTVVPPGRLIPSGQLWGGNPAQYKRDLTPDEIADIPVQAKNYAQTAYEHSSEFLPHSFAYREAEKVRAMQQ
eukprot:CAMPEP_0114296598 /NCGR_PEP_ID=MMETSP0059-20121206/11397_1 /TAXON_ID=36894 /ORGANISM="Pyramimonas parkeae, Strain CCMP726" /LENGTH=238 /DNA_ID=CAMNT_0001418757 /DNA_START=115 /DNA_END=831 /DNA_ORIENTATION=+